MDNYPTPIPIFFFDGIEQQDKGFVDVNSLLNFKRFQSQLSQKMGFPPNQLLASFIFRRRAAIGSDPIWIRVPITAHTNFSMLRSEHTNHKESNAYFLVSLKKPKRERKGPRKWAGERDPRDDDWMRDKGHIDEFLVDKNDRFKAKPLDFAPALRKPDLRMFEGEELAKSEKIVILKRTSPSVFPQQGVLMNGDVHATDHYKGSNEILQQLQSSGSRFSDTRAYGMDFSMRTDGPDLQPYSSIAALSQAELGYRQNSLNGFNDMHAFHALLSGLNGYNALNGFSVVNSFPNTFLPEQNIYKAPLHESVHLGMYKSKGLSWIHDMHKSWGTANAFPKADIISGNPWAYEKVGQFQNMVGETWSPDTINMFQTSEHARIYSNKSEDGSVKKGVSQHYHCASCKSSKVSSLSSFHCCVEDAITEGFKGPSPAGHIGSLVHEISGPLLHMRYESYNLI